MAFILTDRDVEFLEIELDIDCHDKLVAEFNQRVNIPADELSVSGIDNDLAPMMESFYRTSPLFIYDELRELESTTKNFFVYLYLISATRANEGSRLEELMWKFEAARRIDHEATVDTTFWFDGQPSKLSAWSTTNEFVVLLEDIREDSPLAPIERKVNALMDEAAVKRLDWSNHDDVAGVVRLFSDELPQAAAKLRGIDAVRVRDLSVRFREASAHAAFSPWLAERARKYMHVLPLATYLEGRWSETNLCQRGPMLERADWLLENWDESEMASEPQAAGSLVERSPKPPIGVEDRVGAAAEMSETSPDTLLARLAWTAYVAPVLGWATLLGFGLPLAFLIHDGLGLVAATVGVVGAGYRFALLRSIVLCCDDDGVWVQRGVLPWERGTYGVKWRDVDEAVFLPGFLDWATNSYTVVVRHRFTKDTEIVLQHVVHGDRLVQAINDRHSTRLAEGDA